jgi:hypothetical protein
MAIALRDSSPPANVIPVLPYANVDPAERPPMWLGVARLITAITAVVIVFLDFAYHVSPFDVGREFVSPPGSNRDWEVMRLAGPFFLAFPLLWMRARQLFAVSLSLPEYLLIRIAAAVSAATTAWWFVPRLFEMDRHDLFTMQSAVVIGGFMAIPVGAFILIFWRQRIDRDGKAAIALHAAYISNAIMCICGFDSGDPGWYLTVVVVPTFAVIEVAAWLIPSRPSIARIRKPAGPP